MMQGGVVLLVVVAALTRVSGQCLSDNDELNVPASNDLSSITDFGLELFKELFPYNSTTRNFFFSPYSVWNALTLAYFGSGGETQTQLETALRVTDKVSTLRNWRALEFLYHMRQANNSDYTFNLANRVLTRPTEAADAINSFVSETTKGRIPILVEPQDVSQAKMVLANAAFFKGTWLYQFKPSHTRKNLFYATPQDYVFVDMMTQKGNFRHGVSEELGAHILELPYTGEAVSMYILLPPFISGEKQFNAMVERINASILHEAFNNMWRVQIEVVFPKFKLEQMIEDELITHLFPGHCLALASPTSLTKTIANLTTFSPAGNLSIGKSIHKAFLEVSEEGTEAAATALISWRIARPLEPE
ncbi:Serine protease inhibitor 88Ea-like 1, partial [Homarus americanus]